MPKNKAFFIASWIVNNCNPDIALPNTWDCTQPVPKFPYQITIDENDDDYQHLLRHAKKYVGKEYGGYGQFLKMKIHVQNHGHVQLL